MPPAFKMSMPHFAARGCVHATMPLVLCTTLLRPVSFCMASDAGEYTEAVVRGILGSWIWQVGELAMIWSEILVCANLDILDPIRKNMVIRKHPRSLRNHCVTLASSPVSDG